MKHTTRTIEAAAIIGIAAGLLLLCMITAWAADELTLNTSLVFSKSGVVIQNSQNLQVDVSASAVASGTASITTTATAVSLGGVSTAGYALLFNATTNSWSEISYGTVSNTYSFKLKAGEVAVQRLATNSLWAVSTTNACDLYYIILSN